MGVSPVVHHGHQLTPSEINPGVQRLGLRRGGFYQVAMRMQFADSDKRAVAARGPRVLLCIPTLRDGGAERQVRLLAGRLVERGVALSLFARLSAQEVALMTRAGVRCFPIRARGNHSPLLPLEMIRAVLGAEAEIVHTFLPQMDVLGGSAALLMRRVWLLSERSSPQAYAEGRKNRFRAWLGRRADAIVANSAAGLDVWPEHAARHVISNGLDLDAIQRAPTDLSGDRDVLSGRTVVISIARLSPEKRLERLIAAAARIRRELPDLLLVLVGSGPAGALEDLAARLGVRDHVYFAGYRTDIWSWLKRASAFASTSSFEGQPNAVLEAAAAGIPQILSDIPMHRDAVGDDGALFVNPEDEAQLAAAILAHVKDRDSAARFAAAARARVAALSIDGAADLFVGLYQALTAAPRAAGAEQA
jgi:glycosyltransferase involved in cell wall biosynthesis